MKWQDEFPTFPAADMPSLSSDWLDMSWRNDAGPNFYNDKLRAWLFVLPHHRDEWPFNDPDIENMARISVYHGDENTGPDVWSKPLAEGEEWQTVLAVLENPETERAHICDKWTVCLGVSFHPDSRGENYPTLTSEEKERFDSDMARLFEISQDPYADGLAAFARAGIIEGV